jgi:hypothetical protein
MKTLISRAGFVSALLGVMFAGAVPALAQTTRSANFSIGDTAIVAVKVNVRSSPNGAIVGKQVAGATGTLIGGPVNKAGYTWWKINYTTGVDGWTAEDFIQNTSVSVSTSASPVAQTSTTDQKLSDLRAQLNALLAQINALSQTAAAAGSR